MFNDIKEIKSSDENVKKFVFTKSTAVAEAVLYKYPTYEDRTVICCSTQSGCPVGCRFCGAGDYFIRSLTAEEIVAQPKHLLETTGVDPNSMKRLQIMFMSMGEPMLNYKNVKEAIIQLHALYPKAALLISTSAPDGQIHHFSDLAYLSRDIKTIGLQFSVHESTDEARKKLIPTKTMSLDQIAGVGDAWAEISGRRPFFNYCVHPDNDTQADVDRLVALYKPEVWEATISVICERDEHIAAANKRQESLAFDFMQKMLKSGYSTRMFNPAGQDDIGGGCGQLWFVQDWMKQNPDLVKRSKGCGLEKRHTPR